LTPIEAARIRAVAEPEVYKSLGLVGTLGVIAREDDELGWKKLWAGLPSLMTRQVIFGSVKVSWIGWMLCFVPSKMLLCAWAATFAKTLIYIYWTPIQNQFLAFERTSETIFATWPGLRDATFTALGVSLVAGGISGVLSSVVSQPADSVLTYVSKQRAGGNLGVFDGAKIMVQKEGVGSLFRGLGSRCVWAGCIIAGQFLLYDVFRSLFGITADDLNQVFEIVLVQRWISD
jgi:solute carrier family 25 phosphate transporter 3